MKTRTTLIGLFVVLLVGWFVWHQIRPWILAEKVAPSGEARILVREVQLRPLSLAGLFRANEKLYRCEYYPHRDWPLFSAETFSEESYTARKIEVEWPDNSTAKVLIDGAIVLICNEGHWKKSSNSPANTH